MIDELLMALSDGKWHTVNELSTYEPLRTTSITTLIISLNFLAEYDFVDLMGSPSTILEAKLNSEVQRYLRRIRWTERSNNKH